MQAITRSIAAVFAMLLLSSPAGAALIDLGNVTKDTDTGLSWLDLTETLGLSMNDVTSDVGGFYSAGWRHATAAQICGLYAAHAAAPSVCPGGIEVTRDHAAVAAATDLINLLGVTSGNSIAAEAGGLFEAGILSPGTAALEVVDRGRYVELYTSAMESGLLNRYHRIPSAGNFLVIANPEPTPLVLVGLGLIGLAVLRRSQR